MNNYPPAVFNDAAINTNTVSSNIDSSNTVDKVTSARGFRDRALIISRRSLFIVIACSLLIGFAGCALPLGQESLKWPQSSIPGENLREFVSAPVVGSAPQFFFNAGTYTGRLSWMEGAKGAEQPMSTPKFVASTDYAAVVTLSAASGYSFADVPAAGDEGSFFYNRSVEVEHGAGNGESLKVTIHFGEAETSTGSGNGNGGDGSGNGGDGSGNGGGGSAQYVVSFSGKSSKDDSAIDEIRAAKDEGETFLYLRLGLGTEKVDLTAADTDIAGGLILDTTNSPKEVVIDGGGKIVELESGTDPLITVKAGIKLTLGNITLKGRSDNTQSLIKVDGNEAELIFETGAVITGNTAVNGGGVSIINGRFTMNAGTIDGNTAGEWGGGVYVDKTGEFTMRGGEISRNTAKNGGGVGLAGGGGSLVVIAVPWSVAFNANRAAGGDDAPMSGGTLWGNRAAEYGGGVCVGEKAVFEKTADSKSGTIYGSRKAGGGDEIEERRNTAGNRGAAVFVFLGNNTGRGRSQTVGPDDKLDSTVSTGWDD